MYGMCVCVCDKAVGIRAKILTKLWEFKYNY